jgi:hypothetical protein
MRQGLAALIVIVVVLVGLFPAKANIDFIVFFSGPNPEQLDPEQWRVTAEAVNVIAEFADAYKREGDGGLVLLSGHDQKFGSAENAMLRSQRRADAVRDVLIAHGLPARVISTKACGWARMIVPTDQDVKEPQNRYVFFWWARDEADLLDITKKACLP